MWPAVDKASDTTSEGEVGGASGYVGFDGLGWAGGEKCPGRWCGRSRKLTVGCGQVLGVRMPFGCQQGVAFDSHSFLNWGIKVIGYLLIAGIGYGVAFWISSRGVEYWRSVVGFFLALVVGWLGGGLIVVGVFALISPDAAKDAIVTLLGRGFWWAAVGAGFGVYRGRSKFKKVDLVRTAVNPEPAAMLLQAPASIEISNITHMQMASPSKTFDANEAYSHSVNTTLPLAPTMIEKSTEEDFWATAMNEVETGQRRPGVWAKAFAECDGDETRAKVAYLKARVGQLTNAAEAQVAQEEADKLAEVEMAKADALAVEQETERLESIDSAKHEAMELETERLRAIEKSKHEALKENQFVNKFWLVVILILGILFML